MNFLMQLRACSLVPKLNRFKLTRIKEVRRARAWVISFITLAAGRQGSSLNGAILIACGSDERAGKVTSIVRGIFFSHDSVVCLEKTRYNYDVSDRSPQILLGLMAGFCLALSTSSLPDVTTARKSSVKFPFFFLFFVCSV